MDVTCVEATFQNRVETYKFENRKKEDYLIPEKILTAIEDKLTDTVHVNIEFKCVLHCKQEGRIRNGNAFVFRANKNEL